MCLGGQGPRMAGADFVRHLCDGAGPDQVWSPGTHGAPTVIEVSAIWWRIGSCAPCAREAVLKTGNWQLLELPLLRGRARGLVLEICRQDLVDDCRFAIEAVARPRKLVAFAFCPQYRFFHLCNAR